MPGWVLGFNSEQTNKSPAPRDAQFLLEGDRRSNCKLRGDTVCHGSDGGNAVGKRKGGQGGQVFGGSRGCYPTWSGLLPEKCVRAGHEVGDG